MRLLTIIFVSLFVTVTAQNQDSTELVFNSRFFDCEDKWVALQKDKSDSTYSFGFIYLDEQAGFTYNFESEFQITNTGEFKAYPRDTSTNIKLRIEPNWQLVAIIPSQRIMEMGLPIEPEWLKYYKSNPDTLVSLIKRGFHYNAVGASVHALPYLKKAYELQPHASGLEFELAYAFNALGKYDEAIDVLIEAIENDPNNYMFYREYGFALLRQDKIEEAEKIYIEGIEISDNDFEKSEMAVNMAQAYYKIRDKKNFEKWAKLTKKYSEKNSRYMQYIDYFRKDFEE